MIFALPPANCLSSREENSAGPLIVKVPFPSPAGPCSLQPCAGFHSSGCCSAGFHLPVCYAQRYSLAQVASMQGLMEEEKGRGGHRVELIMVETPVFSTFLQMALRVWVPSPQLVEHWWRKRWNACKFIIPFCKNEC